MKLHSLLQLAPHLTRKKRGHGYLGIAPAEPLDSPGKKVKKSGGSMFLAHISPKFAHILWKRPCGESFNTQKHCENGNDPYLEILWNTSPYSTHTSITVLLDGLKPQKLLIGDDDIPGRKYLRPPAMLLWGGTVVPFFHGWLRVDLATFRRGPAWCRKLMSLGLQTPPPLGFCLHPYH